MTSDPPNPFVSALEAKLRSLGVESMAGLAKLGGMEHGRRLKVLDWIAGMAFSAQHIGNITLGRQALSLVPLEVLTECWEEMAAPFLATHDEWEYRRMAEFLEMHAVSLLPQHLQICAGHADTDIREIATE
ncbi:hypothetical protein [Prosthecobacter sp.]|uniref:hypothetical protein n=1 Tax=Prosthecobacter sp. TaxID=1965333 RepID=UPI0037841A1A